MKVVDHVNSCCILLQTASKVISEVQHDSKSTLKYDLTDVQEFSTPIQNHVILATYTKVYTSFEI